MMKKAQQMRTMFPMGLRDEMSVSTTSFRPGARLITLEGKEREGVTQRDGRGVLSSTMFSASDNSSFRDIIQWGACASLGLNSVGLSILQQDLGSLPNKDTAVM